MQELRLVLIIVGALAIIALLFHGLWTSKKEKKSKFVEKPSNEKEAEEISTLPEDDFEIVKKPRKDTAFDVERSFDNDPLDPLAESSFESSTPLSANHAQFEDEDEDEDDLPSITLNEEMDDISTEETILFSDGDVELISKPRKVTPEAEVANTVAQEAESEEPSQTEDELKVIVLHVHCSGEVPFIGTKLFDSMQQNGLIYGEMDIFHRHADLSGNGKVLFSVANMMQPGTLQHDDPATFTTKGISFFMTLPGFGEAEQNFKLMLKTAQQIADDLSANVLDDQRNLLTPDKLSNYRNQIREFAQATPQQS